MAASPKLVIIGLDCAPPSLVFDQLKSELPHLRGLMDRGMFGPLRSVMPPITMPAWACMTTGKDPGELGVFGFRNRSHNSYDLKMSDAESIKDKSIFEYLGNKGYKVASLFVPPSWPTRPVHGQAISCFLCPPGSDRWTFPASLGEEIRNTFGDCPLDIEDFRLRDKAEVRDEIFSMTEKHFQIAEWMVQKKKPDVLMMVEMGPDRLHHVFWQDFDSKHPRYESNNPFEDVARQYYAHVDQCLGRVLETCDDKTNIMVVSDHGAKAMQGGFCINQWLMAHGYLVLHESFKKDLVNSSPRAFDAQYVDWEKTTAWAAGGYYGRLMLNVQGREPKGKVAPHERVHVRDKIKTHLESWMSTQCPNIGIDVMVPETLYRKVRGFAPDLLCVVGDLDYRVIGSVGHAGVWTDTNDQGADGCNHDWNGIAIFAGPKFDKRGYVEGMGIGDVARTALSVMDITPPKIMQGTDWSTKQ